MDRQIPDVWNIFSLGGPTPTYDDVLHRHGHECAPNAQRMLPIRHHLHHHPSSPDATTQAHWPSSEQRMFSNWHDRSSVCDRPRTYDKFYKKGPGNFQGGGATSPDSAISMCSSEDGEELHEVQGGSQRVRKRRRRRTDKGLGYSRTITEKDVRHIERQLSMKKTIRKKIMRDLQQAFVGDPDEFEAGKVPKEKQSEINLNSLNFENNGKKSSDPRFLDLLKGEDPGHRESDDSGHVSGPSPVRGQIVPMMGAPAVPDSANFVHVGHGAPRSVRGSSKGRHHRRSRYSFEDSSSQGHDDEDDDDEDAIIVTAEMIEARPSHLPVKAMNDLILSGTPVKGSSNQKQHRRHEHQTHGQSSPPISKDSRQKQGRCQGDNYFDDCLDPSDNDDTDKRSRWWKMVCGGCHE